MVLLRGGNETTIKKEGRMEYYEDSVWSMAREAQLRVDQLRTAGYYAKVTDTKTKDFGTYYTVWNSQSKRKGSRRK